MKRTLFFASLSTETNTFSNIPTTEASFEAKGVERGRNVFEKPDFLSPPIKSLLLGLASQGVTVVASVCAQAEPGAPTKQSVYEKYRTMIIDDLHACSPVDFVLLSLHGAMVSQGCYDCEGDILDHVRRAVGPNVPVGAVLDPHAHLTEKMVSNASVMAFMKEYPHTDGLERTRDVLKILFGMLDASINPTPAVFDCRMIGFFPTQNEPMRGFVDRLITREGKDGILTVSFVHGFPWGDTPDTGAKVLVYANGDPATAARVATEIHDEIWAIKTSTLPEMVSVETAMEIVAAEESGLIVLADLADNPGGGAPSDSTFILRAVLDAGLTGVAFGLFYDPEAVRTCFEVGMGATVDLRIGGKIGRASGMPVDLTVKVMGLRESAFMELFGTYRFAMGNTAWVRGCGVDIVLNTVRIQLYDPTGFTHIGLDPLSLKALVVKSSNDFQIGFGPIAKRVLYVNTPGAIDFDFTRLPYRVFCKPYYPKVDDPFAE